MLGVLWLPKHNSHVSQGCSISHWQPTMRRHKSLGIGRPPQYGIPVLWVLCKQTPCLCLSLSTKFSVDLPQMALRSSSSTMMPFSDLLYSSHYVRWSCRLSISYALQGWQQTVRLFHCMKLGTGHTSSTGKQMYSYQDPCCLDWSSNNVKGTVRCPDFTFVTPFPPTNPHAHQESEHIIIGHSFKWRAIWAISLFLTVHP